MNTKFTSGVQHWGSAQWFHTPADLIAANGLDRIMASDEVTGYTHQEVAELRFEYKQTPLHQDHDIPFEVAYCLTKIGKQPDEYDGPQRFCVQRAKKRDDYDGDPHDVEAYAPSCRYHGGTHDGGSQADNLENPHTAALKHGLWAEDEHLRMDFTDAEQALYDSIIETWPDVYNWPDEDDDPARYLMLRKVATNVVRSNRAEDYLDEEGEVHFADVFDDDGVVIGEEPEENPLSREYRLLIDEIVSLLKELGLTPKERAKMDKVEAEADAAQQVADIANDALGGDAEYDPTQFQDDGT